MSAKIRQLLGIAAAAFAMLGIVEPVEALNFSNMDDLDNPPGQQFPLPPNSVAEGNYESNSEIFFFQEQSNFELPADVNVDANQPNPLGYNASMTSPGVIFAGTRVDSFYFSFDPVGSPSQTNISGPTITFDAPILGMIYLTDSLNSSDTPLARSGMIYDGQGTRGFETNGDLITWRNDNRTLDFTARVTGGRTDQARVLVAIPFEFSPGLGLVLAVGLIGSWELRKRLNKQSEISS